jgi:hypothetical protein
VCAQVGIDRVEQVGRKAVALQQSVAEKDVVGIGRLSRKIRLLSIYSTHYIDIC